MMGRARVHRSTEPEEEEKTSIRKEAEVLDAIAPGAHGALRGGLAEAVGGCGRSSNPEPALGPRAAFDGCHASRGWPAGRSPYVLSASLWKPKWRDPVLDQILSGKKFHVLI